MAEQELLNTDAHVLSNHAAAQNEPYMNAVIMTHISLKEGIKKWGKKGRCAVNQEMKKIHTRDTFIPLNRKDLTEEQRNTILDPQHFLKEKRYGNLKVRTVSGDKNERYFISKEDTSSPKLATLSVLLT